MSVMCVVTHSLTTRGTDPSKTFVLVFVFYLQEFTPLVLVGLFDFEPRLDGFVLDG